jgi:sodium transport system ATP-binding protein
MIEVNQLSKTFETGKGRQKKIVHAVKDVSFAAANSRITGLLGPNGAGKTTTMRMLCTLVVPSSGSASVDGLDCAREGQAVRNKLGVLSDARGLYQRLTTRENIRYFGQLQGLAGSMLEERVEKVIAQIGLESLADRRTEGFSQGERMKVALARALVHNPPNLILDEPTNGLDIMTIRSLRHLLRQLRDEGKCILLSTHIMQEVTALADEVVIISQGTTVAQGSVPQLLARAGATDLEEAFVKLAFGPHADEPAHQPAELAQ